MADEQIRGQTQVFEEAMESVAHEISQNMFDWNFTTMIQNLRAAIKKFSPPQKGRTHNEVRCFCQNYLELKREDTSRVRAWLNGKKEMSVEEIGLVLRVLNRLGNNTPAPRFDKKTKPVEKIKSKVAPKKSTEEKPTSGIVRKLIDFTITLFNSLVGMVVESGVKPADVFDGDRMQMRSALQKVCDRFGIAVVFPESETTHNEPLTREDLAGIGLPTRQRRKNQ